jgi:hypothetical protein
MTGVRFGCGEFVPGGENVFVPNLPVPTPGPTLEPKDPRLRIPPIVPPDPPIKWVKCVEVTSPGDPLWQDPPAGFEWVDGFRLCLPCDGIGANPNVNEEGCTYISIEECQADCVPEPRKKEKDPDSSVPGPTTGGPSGTGNSSDVPDSSVKGPITQGGYANWWFCNSNTGACSKVRLPSKRGQPVGSFSSKVNCERSCVAQSGNIGSNIARAPTPVNRPTSLGSPKIPGVVIPDPSNNFNISIINVQQQANIQDPPDPNLSNQGSQLYNPKYNFFSPTTNKSSPSNSTINSKQSVFKSVIPKSVATLVNSQGSNVVWDESSLSLSLEDVKKSISPELLQAFRTIHFPGGQLVGETSFLEMLRKHLMTGTMSEFDESFYLNLSISQKGDKKIIYTGLQNKEVSERAGLGVIASESVLADSEGQVNLRKRQMRRQRRLNTDIRAKCTICRSGYGVEKNQDIFLSDSGICVTLSGTQNSVSVPTGNGDGYYMYINQLSGLDCKPLVTTNESDSTYYVSENTRYNALTLFRESTEVTLTASSLSSHHELIQNDPGVSALKPLFMTVDLESIGLETNENPLVSTYSAKYTTLEDQASIDEYTKNNGMSITRVNIDYRDPLYRYILDTSTVSLSQKDINFKAVNTGKDYPGGILIAKNLPFGLIVTPVAGSKFNPFNGFSEILTYEPQVVRLLGFRPSIRGNDSFAGNPELKQENLYNSTGGDLKVGLVEPNDTQNVLYKYDATSPLYTETFYRDGSYQTSSSPVSSTGTSFMIKDVLDYLYTTYSPDEILWFDVLRRMPLNRVGELFYDYNNELLNRLERGFRHNMKINYLLKSDKDLTYQILEDDDKVIIKKGDR